ncbi:XdhC family protein [Aquibacillus koreensis]|uniref:XdhC family protein n=1 Tax=Aquibacillus koreensis TaxID=279446 RepID=A0A9X3WM70_9BACI|nr:XdhC family protein [Aquibacillus koreensis]MCT2537794.1 XdhC family protein [Aquibacillus koreensis]MDC3421173.1 XdhC family protein [Aquibacillus koreensis]
MNDLYDILDTICISDEDGFMARIIRVEGSAYKKEGAMAFFQDNGSQVGLISGGCLEEDLAVRIQNGIQEQSCTISYDMRGIDSLTWGEGSGCNGVIDVLVERIEQDQKRYLQRLKSYLDKGKSVTYLKKLREGDVSNDYLYVAEDHDHFGEWIGEIPKNIQHLGDGIHACKDLGYDVYVQHMHPKQRLIIFGAGIDARPLVSFATATGFHVTVADWRPALCTKEKFPNAAEVVIGFPAELLARIQLTENDFVVILTHNFEKDKELLATLMHKKVRYLGVLGSKQRTRRLLGGKPIPENITSPIGLSIQAEGPQEIAISVVAELIQISKRRDIKKACIS